MVTLALAGAIPQLAHAQEFRMKMYTAVDGLSNSCVNDVIQDSDGFLWVGTSSGLDRFDGYEFKNYFSGSEVRTLHQDDRGRIWAGMTGGRILCYNREYARFEDLSDALPVEAANGDIAGFAQEADGSMWVAIDRVGLVCLDDSCRVTRRYENDVNDARSLSHNALTAIVPDGSGSYWISTWGGGLNRFNPHTGAFIHPLANSQAGNSKYLFQSTLHKAEDGKLWIGTTFGGVMCFDPHTSSLRTYTRNKGGLLSDAVMDIVTDRNGNVWVSTPDGVCLMQNGSQQFVAVNAIVEKNVRHIHMANCLFCDRDNSVWLGTNTGLLQYNKVFSLFETCVPSGELTESSIVLSALKDMDGAVWVVDDRGVYRSFRNDDGSYSKVDIQRHLPEDKATTLMMDRTGNVYIAYQTDLLTRYNRASGRFEHFHLGNAGGSEPFRIIECLYEDSEGLIWVGAEVGVVCFNPVTKEVSPLIRSGSLIYSREKVNDIAKDRSGNLWVATRGGLFRYDRFLQLDKEFTDSPASSERGLHGNDVNCVMEDGDGTIWAGTTGGLHRLDAASDEFELVCQAGAALSGPVYDVAQDTGGNLWIASSSGLLCYDCKGNQLQIFDEGDGLLSRDFGPGAINCSPDGEMIVGGLTGVNRFRPATMFVPVRKQSELVLVRLNIFNEPLVPDGDGQIDRDISCMESVTLRYDQSMLSFSFTAPEYLYPGKQQFLYMLEGVDDGWISTGSSMRQATYANLRPGHYVFKLRRPGDDATDVTSLRINIQPPFWATWWAVMLYVLAALFIVSAFLVFYMHRQRLRARHEMDEIKLQFFTNISHEFRTSLTLIMGPLDYMMENCDSREYNLLAMMKSNAARLMRLVNQLLDYRKVEADKMTVNYSTQDIVSFVRDVYNVFQQYALQLKLHYEFSTDLDFLVMDFDKDKVDKVVYNLLSNAFKYTNAGGSVKVNVSCCKVSEKDFVCIKVADTGIGMSEEDMKYIFNRFYQVNDRNTRYRGGSGLGLNMTRELLTMMGGEISVESAPGRGSVFTVLLPVVHEIVTDVQLADGSNASDVAAAAHLSGIDSEQLQKRSIPLVLVVEDNVDMQSYVKVILSDKYSVIVAANGAEGMKKAVECMPDIIVSDVMMPVMDGVKFYEELKKDERINHIPVIFLSAVNDDRFMAEAFRLGVDGYMTKPFNPGVLLARIDNIFAKRRDAVISKTAGGDSFVSELMAVITTNLADSSYGVDRLADDMNMTTVHLSRKVKETCDMTPYSLIIKMRMDNAVRLIKESELNISEIAFKCGYQELSNFSRAFTRYWNESPTHLMKKLKNTSKPV